MPASVSEPPPPPWHSDQAFASSVLTGLDPLHFIFSGWQSQTPSVWAFEGHEVESPRSMPLVSPCGVTAQVMLTCQSTGLLKAESKF